MEAPMPIPALALVLKSIGIYFSPAPLLVGVGMLVEPALVVIAVLTAL